MIPSPFEPFFEANGVVILDGGLATELERRGADLDNPLWSARVLIDRPEIIRDVHYDYYAAGADVAISATYQASLEGFARAGLSRTESQDMYYRAITLANEARERAWADPAIRDGRVHPLVAVSIGSYGAYLADGSEYRGDFGQSRSALAAFHRERLEIFLESPAPFDLFAMETIPSLEETHAIAELLSDYESKPAWFSFSCRDDAHIADGTPLADCVALLDSVEAVVAIGINCTAPRHVESLVRIARSVTEKPVIVYPNSGEGWDEDRRRWTPAPAEDDIAGLAPCWYAAGARGFGGCCRTTPNLIAELRRVLP